jgi:hypothetical protein
MNKSYYNSTIKEFLERDEQSILGALTSSENIFDITPKSSTAWVSEIKTMKKSLKDIDGYIHFEFIIPRMGKRVDILLVIKNIIFIIEFKVGSDEYDNASITQVTDYALDIKNFHEGTHDKVVCPILVSTDADLLPPSPLKAERVQPAHHETEAQSECQSLECNDPPIERIGYSH